jgi:hypothetical protein
MIAFIRRLFRKSPDYMSMSLSDKRLRFPRGNLYILDDAGKRVDIAHRDDNPAARPGFDAQLPKVK